MHVWLAEQVTGIDAATLAKASHLELADTALDRASASATVGTKRWTARSRAAPLTATGLFMMQPSVTVALMTWARRRKPGGVRDHPLPPVDVCLFGGQPRLSVALGRERVVGHVPVPLVPLVHLPIITAV
ncbi:MAG: hypothetical protein ACLQVK_17235 [Acidimicrobiales bacterium]